MAAYIHGLTGIQLFVRVLALCIVRILHVHVKIYLYYSYTNYSVCILQLETGEGVHARGAQSMAMACKAAIKNPDEPSPGRHAIALDERETNANEG